MKFNVYLFICFICLFRCTTKQETLVENDPHSFSKPEITKVRHLDLELNLDFNSKRIDGIACYTLEKEHGNELILDMMDIAVKNVQLLINNEKSNADYKLGNTDSILGTPLIIKLDKNTEQVCITYNTLENAIALQWIPAEQTLGKKLPFLFTQSQSIYARSWIPSPDGPGMRFTYNAKVKVPPGMMAVMSAENSNTRNADGNYEFKMDIPIPAYLLALAVGDFDFKSIGARTGVYADSQILDKAAYEFEDLEKMLETAEQLFGKYPWSRYDVIVLPPSFPFGGMENPRMTFLTPSVIAGDQSLTSLLAHELAHSWSGNLVTNASWNDFWLNEGFTTYCESRIMESLYGKEYADMLSLLGYKDLQKTMDEMGDTNPLTKLKLDLKNQDPEDGLSDIAYEKGKALLRFLEIRIGRSEFDAFLKKYFEHFKFKSNTSEGFINFFEKELKNIPPGLKDTVKMWVYNPGMMPYFPKYTDQKFKNIEQQIASFLIENNVNILNTDEWSTHEWIYFLRSLPVDKNKSRCEVLEKHFKLSQRNFEIRQFWFDYAIRNNYGKELLPQIREFLKTTGRRKFLMPIYEALLENELATEANQIFEEAKQSYHPIARESVRDLLKSK